MFRAISRDAFGRVECCGIQARAPGKAGVVVLLDTWFPGWQAEVDGEPRPLLRTNYAFRGVEVGPEDREVRIYYAPTRLTLGLSLAALGCLLAAGLGAWPRLAKQASPVP